MGSKSETKKSTQTKNAAEPTSGSVEVAGVKYKVLEDVRVPNFKMPQDQPVALRILTPIVDKPKQVKGEDGVVRMATISTCRVLDHATGETGEMVVGAALLSILRDYDGGNGRYVGLDFLITKCKAPEGKRYKEYKVSRIEVA